MRSLLTVTTAAADRSLLTIEELRAAVGVTDGSKDAALTSLGLRVSASITAACKVWPAGATPPTLREEVLTETYRHRDRHAQLRLSRRPIVSITSITEDDTALTPDEYEVDPTTGIISRLDADWPLQWLPWRACLITVVYTAGWATVPDDLKLAAVKLATTFWTEAGRDPNLRRVEVPGVLLREYWVPPTTDPAFPQEVIDLLSPYMNIWLG